MNKIVTLCASLIAVSAVSTSALAATPGVYAGAGLGYSKIETSDNVAYPSVIGGSTHSLDNTGLAGRIFSGYNFNQYLGVEAGYARYAKSSGTVTFAGIGNSYANNHVDSFDLVGKAYLPIADSGFNLYALAGAAYQRNTVDYGFNVPGNNVNNDSVSTSKLRPKYGVGVSYDIPQTQFTTNLEITRVNGYANTETTPRAIPVSDMATLNISYNFN